MERQWNANGTRVCTEGSLGFGGYTRTWPTPTSQFRDSCPCATAPSLLLALVLARAVRTACQDVTTDRQDHAITLLAPVRIAHDGTAYGQDSSL
jgi:hypothetical protein